MSYKLTDILQVTSAVKPQSIATGTTGATSSYVAAKMFERIAGVGHVADLGTTKTLTVQLMQAQDASATGAKVLGTAATAVASGTQSLTAVACARQGELDSANGFGFVAVKISHDHGSNRDCSAALIRNKPVVTPASLMSIA